MLCILLFVTFISANGSIVEYNRSGTLLWLSDAQSFQIVELPSGKLLHKIDYPGVQAISFSPSSKYFVTWERLTQEKQTGNLIIWSIQRGVPVAKFTQKQIANDVWPVIQWSEDDQVAARAVPHEIYFYEMNKIDNNTDNSEVISNPPIDQKLKVENFSAFSLSPTPRQTLKGN